MKHRLKKLFAVILAVAMTTSITPMFGGAAFAATVEGDKEAPKIEDGLINLNKTATDLDDNLETQINLSFPGAEDNLGSDIVFVLDKSGASAADEISKQSLEALQNLHNQSKGKGTPIKVGVVLFNRFGNVKAPLTDISTDEGYNKVVRAMKSSVKRGTNMHAGLLAGRKLLDDDTSVRASRKHMVLISDGATYLFSKNDDPSTCYTKSFGDPKDQINPATGKPFPNSHYMQGGIWEYQSRDYNITYTDEEKANGLMFFYDAMKNVEDLTKYLGARSKYLDDYAKYDYQYKYGGFLGLGDPIPPTKEQTTPIRADAVANIDASYIYSDQVFQSMVDKGYKTYVYYKNEADFDGSMFLEYLARNTGGLSKDFVDLQKAVINLIGSGSKVVDKVGQSFDFVNDPEKIQLVFGDETLKPEKISENQYGFGKKDSGQYSFVLTYDKDEDQLTMDINEDVTVTKKVTLTYSEKLTDVPEKPGEYKFKTNEFAKLYCVDDNNVAYEPIDFPVPEVQYKVDPKYYNITFDPNGGNFDGNTDKVTNTYEEGTEISIMEAPEREGYRFLYWEKPEMKPGDKYTVTEDHTFVAKWERIEYKIIFNPNGGNFDGNILPVITKYPEGTEITIMQAPVREGYRFLYWGERDSSREERMHPGESYTVTGDHEFVAKWDKIKKYDITFDPNGGNFDGNTEPVVAKYDEGTEITIMKAPERKGYRFLYWEEPKMNPGDKYTVNGNHTFVAKWEKIEYTVTFDPNGGNFDGNTEPVVAKYDEGAEITIMKAPERKGYRFLYWEEPKMNPGDKYTVTGDHTFVAKWERIEYTVTFDPNGGNFDGNTEPVAAKYSEGTEITIMKAPEREGYRFLYWEEPKMNPGEKYTVTGDHTFVAKWEKIEKYDITFDPNGGNFEGNTSPVTTQYEEGTEITIMKAPVREGYRFLYWEEPQMNPGESYTVTGNHTFVAKWEPIVVPPEMFTITYDLNGGSLDGDINPVTFTYASGTEITIMQAPVRPGYRFLYWEEPQMNPGEKYTVTSDHTFVAKWERIEYTVTFDPNGGNFNGDTSPVTAKYGDGTRITIMDAPVREGYKFLYWAEPRMNPGEEYTVTEDHTFVANWEKVEEKPDENIDKPVNPQTPDDKGKPQTPSGNTQDNTKKPEKGVNTGDASEMGIYALLIIASAATVIAITKRRKLDK